MFSTVGVFNVENFYLVCIYIVYTFTIQLLFMTRIQQYSKEVNEITLQMIKNTMPEPYKIMIELVVFENNPMQMISERLSMIPQTHEAAYYSRKGFVKCKRKEASAIVYISKWDEERTDWVSVKHTYVKTLAN